MGEIDYDKVAADILDEVGDQMGELYAALPDLIWDHCDAYQRLGPDERRAAVQAVAERIGGEGYVYDHPMPEVEVP